jgi:glutathione S-transferase
MITLYGFSAVTSKVVGLTRDLRAQWALEELGLPYRVHGLDDFAGELKTPDYRRINPFEQIPSIEDDGFILSESAAILIYLAEKAGQLIPADVRGAARVKQWCFCAMNTIEPPVLEIAIIDQSDEKNSETAKRRASMIEQARRWFVVMDRELRARTYLAGDDFTVADILMTCVLREIRHTDLLDKWSHLKSYVTTCEARPAWQRTLDLYESRLGAKPGSAR